MMKCCTKCKQDKPLSAFHKKTKSKDGHQSACIECSRKATKDWQRSNPEKMSAINKKWRERHPGKQSDFARAWRDRNPSSVAEYSARRHTSKLRAIPAWANHHAIGLMYATSRYLTQETGQQWHVDHHVPLHGKTVCGLHVHYNLRVVPATYNLSKSNRLLSH